MIGLNSLAPFKATLPSCCICGGWALGLLGKQKNFSTRDERSSFIGTSLSSLEHHQISVGIGTVSEMLLASQPVAGFQRAEPSATLDKSFYIQLFWA
jgi:hypothetical protein